jgi:hypothetical protein
MTEKKNLRTYRLDIARSRIPDSHKEIAREMKADGFKFEKKPCWPMPLKEPYQLEAHPAGANGFVIYTQWDE